MSNSIAVAYSSAVCILRKMCAIAKINEINEI